MFQVKDNALGNIKYVGISRAVVIDNNDPLKRGRIRVNSPVLGETAWIPYLTNPGTFNVPDVDTVVYIQCDGGFYTHPVAWGNLNYGDDNDLQFPEEFQRVSPTNRGIYTPGGHLVEIDDGTDLAGTSRGIRVTTSEGIKLDISDELVDSSIDIKTPSGTHVRIDGTEDAITLESNFGDSATISRLDGIQLSTPAAGGTSISMTNGKIDIQCASDSTYMSTTGNITLTASGGAELKLGASKVALGGTTAEVLDLFDQLLAQLNTLLTSMETETHIGNLGYATSPPVNASAYAAVQAQIAIIKTLLATIKGTL